MQYDPFRSSRDLGLTWPEVKLCHWPFKVILYMVRRALTGQTRWYTNRCSILIKDFIVEKPFEKIGILTPGDLNFDLSQKWPKLFRNDFTRAFERCLSFFSTATRSRDHGGGAFKGPPSRRWKIQRPSRTRVKGLKGSRFFLHHYLHTPSVHIDPIRGSACERYFILCWS